MSVVGEGKSATFRQRLFAKIMASTDEVSHEQYRERKESLFSELQGRVLELGPGTGVNFPFYSRDIEWVGVEPNPAMHPFLREKASEFGFGVELAGGLSRADGIKDESFDFAVSTLVLCSVGSISATP